MRNEPQTNGQSADPEARETMASVIADRLRREIIACAFAPEERLRVRQLAERFGVALSPVREALNRLSSEGLVRQSDLRGFSVMPVSEQDLDELSRTRCWLNERALRESIAHGDAAWEEGVLIAYHRLSRIDRGPSEQINEPWEAAHRAFHRSLIEACGSRWMIAFCEQLFDQADRYRRIGRGARDAQERVHPDEHRAIMDAAVARDAELAVRLGNEHIMRTTELCRSELPRLVPIRRRRAAG